MANIHDLGFPFTSVAGDRQYSASEWREYFDALLTSGVVGEYENQLQIKAQSTPNKTVYVDTGAILINGALRSITSVVNLPIADNTSGNPRIDRIVARLNYTDRKIEFVVKQGTPASSPSPPALTRDGNHWELSLARITVANGFSTIISGSITDERGDESVCGYFKYRAKLMGQVAVDAWMYTNFRHQLTPTEIATIEADSGLMSVINTYSGSAPVGTVIYHAASSPPAGFLKANGAAVSRTTYSKLFSVIGTVYGAGDGSTTFNLPDLRGEFIRGFDDGKGIDSGRVIGSTQNSTKFRQATSAAAAVAISERENETSGNAFRNTAGAGSTGDYIDFDIRPRNVALLACIKY